MIFAQLFALAILVHEAFYLCQDGDTYLSSCFLPTFGLHLTPRQMRATHFILIALCLGVLVRPTLAGLYPALLIALSMVIASYSLRLSNHLVIAWFMALLLCLNLLFQPSGHCGAQPTPFLFLGVQLIVALTYLLAFFHKLNAEYLSPGISCGARLARSYLENRGIRHSRLVRVYALLAIYATLALELSLPALLWVPVTRPIGLCLGVLLHLPFGLLCHFHFSSLMVAGLAAFIPPEAWPRLMAGAIDMGWPALLLCLTLGAALGARWGISDIFRYRRAAMLFQSLFGIYTLVALGFIALFGRMGVGSRSPAWGEVGLWQGLALALVALLFLFNGLTPYLGLKTEFSLAMFSNLRPEPWCHYLIPSRWRPFHLASYVRVERIEGLPARGRHKGGWYADVVLTCLLKPEQWQYSSYFFHEGLRLLCRVTGPTPVVRVTYVERGERHEVSDYAREMAGHPPRYRRANLFPFRLPLDPSVPHCA